jgi:exodeoxyribonuclease V beta subunit
MTIHASKGLGFPIVFLAGGAGREITRHDFLELRNRDGSTDYWIDTSPTTLKRCFYAQCDDENRRLYYVALTRAARAMYLPIWHPDEQSPDILQKYHHTSPSETFLSACLNTAVRNDERGLFHVDEKPVAPIGPAHQDTAETVRILSPGESVSLLVDQTTIEPLTRLTERLRALSLGSRYHCQTSYSALVHGHAVSHTLEGRQNRSEEMENASETEAAEPQDLLPRGSHTGNMLHEIMERVSFEAVGEMASIEALSACEPLVDIVATALRRASIPPRDNLERVLAIVWHCLRAALPDPAEPGTTLRLCDIADSRKVCEMEFHYSFDSQGRFGPGGHAGHVLGYIDLLFRYRDRYYILDWKSNYLPVYSHRALAQSMEENGYTIQKMLYALATDHWLSTRLHDYDFDHHFGGIIYCYMRGARENSDTGFAVSRPECRRILEQDYTRAIRECFLGTDKLRALLATGRSR